MSVRISAVIHYSHLYYRDSSIINFQRNNFSEVNFNVSLIYIKVSERVIMVYELDIQFLVVLPALYKKLCKKISNEAMGGCAM